MIDFNTWQIGGIEGLGGGHCRGHVQGLGANVPLWREISAKARTSCLFIYIYIYILSYIRVKLRSSTVSDDPKGSYAARIFWFVAVVDRRRSAWCCGWMGAESLRDAESTTKWMQNANRCILIFFMAKMHLFACQKGHRSSDPHHSSGMEVNGSLEDLKSCTNGRYTCCLCYTFVRLLN